MAQPLADSALAEEPRLLALSVWHMVSVTLALSARALALGASPRYADRSRFLVMFVSVLWISYGLCVIGVILTQSGDDLFSKFPQPILLIPVGLLGFWGSVRPS